MFYSLGRLVLSLDGESRRRDHPYADQDVSLAAWLILLAWRGQGTRLQKNFVRRTDVVRMQKKDRSPGGRTGARMRRARRRRKCLPGICAADDRGLPIRRKMKSPGAATIGRRRNSHSQDKLILRVPKAATTKSASTLLCPDAAADAPPQLRQN